MSFRVLQGLPAYGDTAQTFPAAFGRLGSQGFVVEFAPSDAATWVGNFRPGLSLFSGAYSHPDGKHVFVVAGGSGYVVDPLTRHMDLEVGGAIVGVWELMNPRSLLLNHQGLFLERIGPLGRLWCTRRLSWDGFRDLKVGTDSVTGLGWGLGDAWLPFTVDLRTGHSDGGAYTGPEMTLRD